MMSRQNKRALGLAAAALILLGGAATEKAMAYFTTYTTAQGGYTLDLGFTVTEPNEKVEDWTKDITIKNTGEKPCYVRVKVFVGEEYRNRLTYEPGDWAAGADGYYYWKEILQPKDTAGDITGSFIVRIDHTGLTESFNVIVVQECIPVPYDDEGAPVTWDKVDWSKNVDVVKTETSNKVNGGEEKP